MIHLSFIWIKFALIRAPVTPTNTELDTWRFHFVSFRFRAVHWSRSHCALCSLRLQTMVSILLSLDFINQNEYKRNRKKIRRANRHLYQCLSIYHFELSNEKAALHRFPNASVTGESLKSHFFTLCVCVWVCLPHRQQTKCDFDFKSIYISAIKLSFFNSHNLFALCSTRRTLSSSLHF